MFRCPRCSPLRTFTSTPSLHTSHSSRRQLQTATAYHPHSLSSDLPPPPRNTGVPDTSIAGGVPETSGSRPPRLMQKHGNEGERPSISVTEGEAQKSKPVVRETVQTGAVEPSAAATSPEGPKSQEKPKSGRRKLRARKAAITLSPDAVQALRGLLDQPEPKLIRVGVKNRGCSGLAYQLEYVDKPGAFDETVEQDGVKVLVDSKALFSIIGSEMDWVEDKLSARFVFKNPNITEQCGCGESFSIG
ncbi:hypothetical protein P152DRAFT_403929 [Eremomyces bilateralis CBS 781.70]|uniref:Iron-sulfur assembly protein 1 n=1 Tax=Eremomyces bilateralis CBS 781.70 TaxID=1392243 RepID=A0A6G1FTU6_9PEZI|nr:uncharacterized protein P152DRAFT_403929 [Eremomyces bilateralis CBS 781.70]KAF1809194.1 hypothetical protein P152DRAFT_403929 [Eremomyces bilateralis CBS 781.70]